MEDLTPNGATAPVRKRPKALLWIIAIVGIALTAGMAIFQMKSTPMDYNYNLYLATKAFNLACPRMIDGETRLDSVSARYDKIYTYNYTLVSYAKKDLDTDVFCEEWETGIIGGLKGNKEMEEFGKNGVTLVFRIRDKTLDSLCTVTLFPEAYYTPSAN